MSRRFLIFLLVIFSFLTGHAGTFGFTTKLQGGLQIVSNATLETQDDQYSSMSATGAPGAIWHANNFNRTIKNYIHLKYTGAANKHYTLPWSVEIGLQVMQWDEYGIALPTQNCMLEVNYNPASGTKYEDISTFSSTNGVRVKVIVTSITIAGPSGFTLPEDLMIENVIEVARTHNMDPRASIYIANTNNHCNVGTNINSANAIEFHWDYLEGAEEYDFEWVFKSVYDQVQTIDFANATRITTTNQYYSVNTAFDNGKIYYRVRGIGKDFATGIKRMEGNWTQSTTGVQVCNIEKRNWTYNAVYAEEGKRKEVMTYFDGSTRNRQSVTLSNSENTGLVGEDIYDYEGRPAVKTLPAPSANLRSDLKFYQNFSLNKDHQWYTKKDFDDDDVSACGKGSTPGLNSSPDAASGASDYYSPNNSVLYGFNGAIPDATDYLMTTPEYGKSFPFSQTVYSNDGTVKMQSGVGPDFKIGSGHETKYLNATASQEKLDRLFGNEVGYAEHYREKAVIDPNGQVSVSYENLSGKVIATAMRGFTPANLIGLGPDVAEEKYMDPEIIHEHFESNYDPASEAYLTLKNFIVTDINTPYDFKYEITPAEFNTICSTNYKCKYLLQITIKDDCGVIVSEKEGSTSSPDNLAALGTIHSIDATNYTGISFKMDYSVMFAHVGVYRIEKRLYLDPAALQTAVDNFEVALRDPNSTCITTLSALNTTYAAGVDMTECMSCVQAAEAETTKVTYPYVLDEAHTFNGSTDYLAFLINQCTPEIPKKSCDGLLAALKADMSPGGQYFESMVSSYTDPNLMPNFDILFSFPSPVRFIDALISPSMNSSDLETYWNLHNYCSTLPAPVNYATLTANWDPCWADVLVLYHPEYCRYQRCVTLSPSYDYDAQLLSMNFDQAISTNNISIPVNGNVLAQSILDHDPYFISISPVDYQTINPFPGTPGMLEELTNCTTCASQFPNGPSPNSMWAWAAIAPEAITPGDNQAQWENFQKLYISVKAQKFVKKFDPLCKALTDITNPADNLADNPNWAIPVVTFQPPQETLQLIGLTINDPEPLINFNTIQTYISGQAAAGSTSMSPYDQVPCTYTNATAPGPFDAVTTIAPKSLTTNPPVCELDACAAVNYPTSTATIRSYTFFASIPSVPNNQSWAFGTCDIQISNPVLLPIDWTGLPINTINGYLLQIKNSIDSYISVPYKFTCNVTYATSTSNLYTYSITAPSSLQMNANGVVLKMVRNGYSPCRDCAEIDPAIYCANFGGARQNCIETPISEPHCLCVQLQQAVDLYNATDDHGNFTSVDHDKYPSFADYESLIAENLSLATTPTVVTPDNVHYWRGKCVANNSLSPFELDAAGNVIVPPGIDPNAVPEELSCNPYEPCQQQGADEAAFYASEAFEDLVYQHLQDFIIQYKQACLNSANLHEQFNVDYYEKEYHYTLYYYDQAGNLVRTVPPKAVNRLTVAQMYSGLNNENKVHLARINNNLSPNTYIYPNHNRSNNLLVTNYKYNTLNQLTQQETPDGGLSNFSYNKIGQMRFSQNAKQLVTNGYSYTIYDGQGRIMEVGLNGIGSTGPFQLNNPVFPTQSGAQVTKTYYDAPIPGINLLQDFLRKRVASTTYEDIEDLDDLTYNSATHYCYDVHGNVNTLVQDFPDLEINNNRYKTINYKYDLISGNVNEVNYQAGQFDQYYHKYEYDANNRITHAYTSNDNFRWQQDARYFYYLHGPLARVEIGEEKVQGLDYAYTLQGWIKGVNSNNLKGYDVNGNVSDVGTDGYINNYIPGQSNIHGNSARDVFGYTLEYNKNDYRSINPAIAGQVTGGIGNSNLYNASQNLYNGNIKAMITAMYQPNIAGGLPTEMPTMARFFNYDQLNRLKDAQSVTTNFDDLSGLTASLLPAQSDYYESFKFDANGNIRNAKRNGYTVGSYTNGMDDITYNYMSETDNNKLDNVGDIPDNPANFNDIKAGQTSGNYKYDEIGNLTHDEAEGIIDIKWSVYGKIQKIYKASENIEFKYNASGNRIEKIIKPASSGIEKTQEHWTYTYYMRDAQGNVMGVYGREVGIVPGTNTVEDVLFLKETAVYGSSRLGIEEQDYRKSSAPKVQYPYGYNADGTIVGGHPTTMDFHLPALDHILGNKKYELSNHLGNVNVVISDRKISENYKYIIPVFGTGNYVFNVDLGIYVYSPTGGPYIRVNGVDNSVDNYLADVLSSTDYYAFGAPMPGRQFNNSTYRYGFNGKENDNEAKGITGSQQDYGLRIYDPRLGKFLSVDPLSHLYPWNSTYAFAENDVIRCVDLDGGERKFVFHQVVDGTVMIVKTRSYKDVFPRSGKDYGDMGPGTLHFWSVDYKELVTSLYDDNDDLSSHLSSVSLNLRGGGGAGPVAGSVGPSLEISDKSFAGSFNLDGSLTKQWREKPALSASIDIGLKFSQKVDNTIKNEFKGTTKYSEKTSINLFGTGIFVRMDVDLMSFDRTYRVGVDLGPKMTAPYSRTSSLTVGIKGVSSENFSLTPQANTNEKIIPSLRMPLNQNQ